MQEAKVMPPLITEVRRPHLSANKKPGMEIANIRIDDKPEARNEALSVDSPACSKSTGAYYEMLISYCKDDMPRKETYVDDSVYSGELNHAEDEQS